jgi:hypothetical protein
MEPRRENRLEAILDAKEVSQAEVTDSPLSSLQHIPFQFIEV